MALATDDLSTRSIDLAGRRPATVLTVCAWELRRLLASRLTLVLGGALAAFFAVVVLFKHQWALPVSDGGGAVIVILASTAWGGIYATVGVLLLFLGVAVPFLTADAVARDQRQRVHELLMTSAVRTDAYVVGRFLAALASALGAAALVASAAVAANLVLHAFDPAYPAPQVGAFVVSWLVLALPAVVLLAGVSFALGTLLPRLVMAVRLGMLLAWVALAVIVDIGRGMGWFAYWTPSGSGVLKVLPPELLARYTPAATGLDTAGRQHLALTVQRQLPDLWPWVGPHAVLALLGVGAAAVAAVAFRRFRGSLA